VEHPNPHLALVVVVRPGSTDATVVANDAHAALRAAVRVAAAAGNTRGWREVSNQIERRLVSDLPPVISEIAKNERMRTCHIAGIMAGGELAAVMLWFSRRERDSAAAVAYRRETFDLLRAVV
jgi:hypothetical protein